MLLILLTSLIISTPDTTGPSNQEPTELELCPTPPEPPEIKPGDRVLLLDNGGVVLPQSIAQQLLFRLKTLDLYPRMCQNTVDRNVEFLESKCDSFLEMERAKSASNLAQQQANALSWHDMLMVGAGGLLAGVLLGFAAQLVW